MQKPTIVITGNPSWRDTITELLQDDYVIAHQAQTTGYMNTLIENLAALIIVDGDADDWDLWASTPKASPATRRIPIVVVSDNSDVHANSQITGGDVAIKHAELPNKIRDLITSMGRLPDAEVQEQLDCECQEPLPDLAKQGIEMFNEGQYYKQHDLFEEQWVATETPVRDLYRAILQVGVAYFQIERNNYRGALKMLQRSVQWLVILPDVCQGVNIKKLRDESFAIRHELEQLGEDNFDQFDKSKLGKVELVPQTN